jgi:hypothetical protein
MGDGGTEVPGSLKVPGEFFEVSPDTYSSAMRNILISSGVSGLE